MCSNFKMNTRDILQFTTIYADVDYNTLHKPLVQCCMLLSFLPARPKSYISFRLSPKLLLTYMVICGYLPALKMNLS